MLSISFLTPALVLWSMASMEIYAVEWCHANGGDLAVGIHGIQPTGLGLRLPI